ncbi:ATP-binding protein [Phenylobacterium sp.]|uniref:PAS domain-containing hybrid sensor histidine kinase/response regulator n=1 Tax=Phenylobacterium sp. TaxID=1871053 RepID=UPI0012028229|nr:ATP-binding protein [Phenylobacterium sp.]THD60393.1 MAG: PAS domain S-box protein [Phenylobacterium sp.]
MAGKSASGAAEKAEMIRWLFENSRDLMQVIGSDGRFKLVNGAWKTLAGWDEAELVGERASGFLHPEDIAAVRDHIRALALGEVAEHPMRVRRRDGAWAWFASRTQKIGNGDLIVTMRDATEERARAEELEETRRTRRLLSESAGIGTWTYEPVEGRIEWSRDLLSLTGYAAEQVRTPEQFQALVHPADRKRTSELMGAAVATGVGATLEHRMKVGGRWTSWRATFRTEPRADGIYALRGISENITELAKARDAARRGELRMKKAEREAQAAAQRLAVALEAAEAGVYEIDHVGKTFWASPEFVRLTGKDEATYAQATQLRFPGFHPDDLDHVRESFRSLHTGTNRAGAFDARIVRDDGQTRWIRVSHHLKVGRNGRWLKAVGLLQDFDERKRQEIALLEAQRAAEAAAEAKSAFLANMSHEIRTPMNGVMGVLHLLKGEKLTEEGRHMLEEALSCGQMLAELLNDVIDFAKIEAGRLELTSEALDPRALVEGVVRLLRPQADSKGLLLRLDAEPGLGWVRSDPVRLRQALFNLVGNAVKFTERGSVTVRCEAPRPGVLRFEIIDTGVGIPPEAQGRIFQRFDQGDASTTRKFGGSGLGLAITKKLADMMGGDVGFSSEPSLGSTFWLEIAAESSEAVAETRESLEPVLEGLKVLVVEDNATNRMIATKLLESLGAEVSTAADGYLGVEAAETGDFHLILMDVQMPGIDGLEAARRIRALGGAPAQTPIVALTANVLAHQRRAYLDAGMDGVVGKPISPGVLLREIARLSAPVEAAPDETTMATEAA